MNIKTASDILYGNAVERTTLTFKPNLTPTPKPTPKKDFSQSPPAAHNNGWQVVHRVEAIELCKRLEETSRLVAQKIKEIEDYLQK